MITKPTNIQEQKERGRPLKFQSVEELETAIENYFAACEEDKKPPTVSGLAYHLDIDRRTITNYENIDEFFPTIKRAKTRIEAFLEERLYQGQCTGVIFNLKNNYKWQDKFEGKLTGDSDEPIQLQTNLPPELQSLIEKVAGAVKCD